MSDDDEELARLRQNSKYRSFQKKFGRDVPKKPTETRDVMFTIQDIDSSQNSNNNSNNGPQTNSSHTSIDLTSNSNASQPKPSTTKNKNKNKNEAEWLQDMDILAQQNSPDTTIKSETNASNSNNANNSSSSSSSNNSNNSSSNSNNSNNNSNSSNNLNNSNNNNSNNVNNNDGKRSHTFSKQERHAARAFYDSVLEKYGLPMKLEAKLKGHNSLVSCLALDRSGTRLLSGSYDCNILFYDFGGMSDDFNSFRSIRGSGEENGNYPVLSIDYNPTGSHFVCVTSCNQGKIFTREGKELLTFSKGDMYIRDLRHTYGHIMPCTGGKWWHKRDEHVITWSQDGSCRLFDINGGNSMYSLTGLKCVQTWKAFNREGKRFAVNTCDVSNDHNSLLMACQNGSIQLYDVRQGRNGIGRPSKLIENAHVKNTETSCVVFHPCQTYLFASRGGYGDNTMKIWDLRKIQKRKHIHGNSETSSAALFEIGEMYNIHSRTNCVWSPNNQLLVTATSPKHVEEMEASFLEKSERVERKFGPADGMETIKLRDFTRAEHEGNAPVIRVKSLRRRVKNSIDSDGMKKEKNEDGDDEDMDDMDEIGQSRIKMEESLDYDVIDTAEPSEAKEDQAEYEKKHRVNKSSLVFFNVKNQKFEEVMRIPICEKSINSILWHNKINHIILGCSDKKTRLYYDDKMSKHGALLCNVRKSKKQHIDDQVKYMHIINPNSLNAFNPRRLEFKANLQKRAEKLKRVPVKPHYGIGTGGRINSENFSAHILKSKEKNVLHSVDPQKALLSWNEKSEEDQYWTKIYKINQPTPIFSETDQNELVDSSVMNEDGHIDTNSSRVIASKGDIDRLMKMTTEQNQITGDTGPSEKRTLEVKLPPAKRRKLNF